MNIFGEEITQGYYKIHNLEELKEILDKLIIQKQDPLEDERKKCLEKLILPQNGVCSVIINYLINRIREGV